jgi:transmembrane E3 ubiquitin-protein ligase
VDIYAEYIWSLQSSWVNSLIALLTLENIAVPFLATTFMAFVLMMYELRFLGLIFRVQRPERPVTRATLRQPVLPIRRGNGTPQNTPANTALNTPATVTVHPTPEDSLTPTVTPAPAPRPPPLATPPVEEQWEPDTRSEYFIITKYFYVSVLSLFILTSWVSAHRILTNILLLALNSFWVPQVYRNVMRGVRKALGWRYVFGMTISRGLMATWLIWYQRGDWVFLWESEERDFIWGWILLGWLWFQVIVLLAQEIFGPRFFISGNVTTLGKIIANESCSLRHIITSRRTCKTKRRNQPTGKEQIVRFVWHRLSCRPCLSPVVRAVTQLR